ncbi:FT-interacting protein 3 [Cardamine amara subsp. amara]|uniref:FT-interacting protein 3 n=1 Tax=Cardamine amara subsp. amara TaxID=228776 RepID=A0ABD1BSB8_CARAN
MQTFDPEAFSVKKITSEETLIGDTAIDLEEEFVYVHVIKANALGFVRNRPNPHVQVMIGSNWVLKSTEPCTDISNPVWNKVFAFLQNENHHDLTVNLRQGTHLVGRWVVELDQIPKRVPSSCTLTPLWYRLQNRELQWVESEVLLAVFSGHVTTDEQWNFQARNSGADPLPDIRSQLYFNPKLWYLRVNVVEASGLPARRNPLRRDPQYFVNATLGNQQLSTRRSRYPEWNQDLVFVAAEPFQDMLSLTVAEMILSSPIDYKVVGRCVIPLEHFERRSDHKAVSMRWHSLDTGHQETELVTGIYIRSCLEGGYTVQHESANYASDFRTTDSKLWEPNIGVLELGIIRATGLKTTDCQQRTSSFCVAKYSGKWVRTNTLAGSTPTWNDVFTWEVFDPDTVVTVGVFQSCDGVETRVGKVRIRISSLQRGRVYTHSYPLLVIHSGNIMKEGEIELTVRFSCSSWLRLMRTYSRPLLPKMYSVYPFSLCESESLRLRAAKMVTEFLARYEPPLKKEVVGYVLDLDSHCWSNRRSKVNYLRIVEIVSRSCTFVDNLCKWTSTPKTLGAFLFILVCIFQSEMVLMFLPVLIFFTGLLFYFWRSELPPHIDSTLSQASYSVFEDLDEELNTHPSLEIISERYEMLRRKAGVAQVFLGHVSGLMERLCLLFSWRDQRATGLFLFFCLIVGIIFLLLWLALQYMYSRSMYMYHVSLSQVIQVIASMYVMRPPRYRGLELPWVNFFRRLPARHDNLL